LNASAWRQMGGAIKNPLAKKNPVEEKDASFSKIGTN